MQRFPLAWPDGWRRTTFANRKTGRFTAEYWRPGPAGTDQGYFQKRALTVAEAVKRVLQELDRLNCPDAIISTNLKTNLDGSPRSGQPEPNDPGAAVYWRDRGHTRVMAIDRYDRVADNLAAIAATLEAMRAIDRHGGAQILDRAFTGFEALPPPPAFNPWAVLGLKPGDGVNAAAVQEAFRKKAKLVHPDAPGGSTALFQELEKARTMALETCMRMGFH